MTGNNAPARADYAMAVPLRVRYNEADMQGIVFNANYLVYADIAVTEYYRMLGDQGFNLFGPDGDVMVRKAEIDYRASAKADDNLDLCGRIVRFGKSSFLFEAAMFRDHALLCLVHITYVHFLTATGRPSPVPQHFREKVAAFEPAAPLQS